VALAREIHLEFPMNVSSTSASSSIWSLLAPQSASKTSSAGGAGDGDALFSLDSGSDADTAPSAASDSPPPPPGEFDLSGSTMQFAQSLGAPPQDPLLSLDSNGDGSVSATESGLDGASSDVQKLFSEIDANGDGSLSTGEVDDFREQMQAAQEAAGGEGVDAVENPPPPAMPPVAGSGESAGTSSDASGSSSDASGSGASANGSPDLSGFLQELASRYLALAKGGDFGSADGTAQGTGGLSAVA
jgi:hypothetical protein